MPMNGSSGTAFVWLGIGILAAWLALLIFTLSVGGDASSRTSTFLVIGVPAGIAAVIIGIVKNYRKRDQ